MLWFLVITGNPGQVIGLNQKDSTKMYMSIRGEAGIDPEVERLMLINLIMGPVLGSMLN